MRPLQSIICFNGGSAGDLMLALSLLAHEVDIIRYVTLQGAVILPYYFKNYSIKVWNNEASFDDINWDEANKIENSHYYCSAYPDIAEQLFYINYSDDINELILSEYIRKRFKGDWEECLQIHSNMIPAALRKSIPAHDYQRVFAIQWMKNLRGWRNNPALTPLEFTDLLHRDSAIKLAEQVANQKFKDLTQFDFVYSHWQHLNSNFFKLVQ